MMHSNEEPQPAGTNSTTGKQNWETRINTQCVDDCIATRNHSQQEKIAQGGSMLHEGGEGQYQRVAFEVQQSFSKRSSRSLHSSLIARVDFEVVAVRAVQPQQAPVARVRVHHHSVDVSQLFRLPPA
jgi:hypothetical protein